MEENVQQVNLCLFKVKTEFGNLWVISENMQSALKKAEVSRFVLDHKENFIKGIDIETSIRSGKLIL